MTSSTGATSNKDRLTQQRRQQQDIHNYATSSRWYTYLSNAISYIDLAEASTVALDRFRNSWSAIYNLYMMTHRAGEAENITLSRWIGEIEKATDVRRICQGMPTGLLESLVKAQNTLLKDVERNRWRDSKVRIDDWLQKRQRSQELSPEKACTYTFFIGRDIRNAVSHPTINPNAAATRKALDAAADFFLPLAIAAVEATIEQPLEGTTGRATAYRSFLYPFLKNSDSFFSDYYLEKVFEVEELAALPEEEAKAGLKQLNQALTARTNTLRNATDLETTRQEWYGPVLFPTLGINLQPGCRIVSEDSVYEPTYVLPQADFSGTLQEEYQGKAAKQDVLCLLWTLPWRTPSLDAVSDDPEFAGLTVMEVAQRALLAADVPWAIVTNGQKLRLLSKGTAHKPRCFLEADLAAIIDRRGEAEGKLAYRYLLGLFSGESFTEKDDKDKTRLERVLEGSDRYGQEISDELKENVFKALEELGQGFLDYLKRQPSILETYLTPYTVEPTPSENLLVDIYQESLSLMYRLLFLFYAESRNLLPMDNIAYQESYSLEALRDEIRNIHDIDDKSRNFYGRGTIDLWDRLKELFGLVNIGSIGLGIPAYNGGLFDPAQHPFLEHFKVGDYYLARAIDLLSRTRPSPNRPKGEGRKKVTYRDLDIRHLGSIYEGILEYSAHIADQELVIMLRGTSGKTYEEYVAISDLDDKERQQLAGWRVAVDEDPEFPRLPRGCKVRGVKEEGSYFLVYGGRESKRKSSGSYYTPEYIVQYIVENTLGPLVRGENREGELKDVPLTPDEILELKVLDPAMGSAHFLVAATEFLAQAYGEAMIRTGRDTDGVMSEEEFTHYKRIIAERCIYGVDVNPMAVELAKLSMWLFTMDRNRPLSFLNHHLKCGNSLIGSWIEDLGELPQFDRSGKLKKRQKLKTGSNLFEHHFKATVPTMIGNVFQIMQRETETYQDVEAKKVLDQAVEDLKFPFRNIADAWLSSHFLEITDDYYAFLTDFKKAQWYKSSVGKEKRFFHWEIEFPEVFLKEDSSGELSYGFSAIVTNPPFKATKQIPVEERRFFWHVDADLLADELDYFELLWIKCRKLLNTKGYFGFVTPSSYLSARSFRHLRKWLLSERALNLIIEFPYRHWPFEAVNTETSVSIGGGNISNYSQQIKVFRVYREHIEENGVINDRSFLSYINVQDCLNRSNTLIALGANHITSKIESLSEFKLGDIAETHKGWMSIPKSTTTDLKKYKQELFSSDDLELDPQLKSICGPILRGDDIQRHYLRTLTNASPQLYVNYSSMDTRTREWQTSPKIVLQRITGQSKMRIIPYVDTKGNYLVHPSANLIVLKETDEKKLLSIGAFLGSKLINYYYKRFFGETNTNIPTELLDYLPIPNISNIEDELAACVEEIMQSSIECMKTVNDFLLKLGRSSSHSQKQMFKCSAATEAASLLKMESPNKELVKVFQVSRASFLKRVSLEEKVNEIIYEFFGLDEKERQHIDFECSKLIAGSPSDEDLI